VRLPRVKDAHRPVRAVDGRILIGSPLYGVASEIADDEEGTVWRLLELLDGTRSPAEIASALLTERPHLDLGSVRQAVTELIGSGFVEEAAGGAPAELSEAERDRYSRGAYFFSWVDTRPRTSRWEIQTHLKRARVAVVGVGGSGSALAMSLVAVGVGSVACFDFDRVESSNLNRQLLYREDDIDAPKAEQAIGHLRRLNSHVEVSGGELRVRSSEDLVPIMKDCDFFALCADTPRGLINKWVNEAALRTGTPWLLAVHAGPMAMVGSYLPGRTPCWDCVQHHAAREQLATWGATEIPQPPLTASIAPTAAISGHLGALEIIYYLAGIRDDVGRQLAVNLLLPGDSSSFAPGFWDECPMCGPADPHP
jgi:molybdopterin-synthase adenylyltransferase